MIIEFFLSKTADFICGSLSLLHAFTIPTDIIKTLSTITCYGAFVCGSDFILALFACVSFLLTVKLTLGIVLFVWRLLPFT